MALGQDLLLATGNPGKVAEIRPFLGPLGYRLHTLLDLGISGPPEEAGTFLENALLKARQGSVRSGMTTLGEDSGLCVQALQGAPGVRSARYAGEKADDAENNARLLEVLRGVPAERRQAFYTCTMVMLSHPEDPDPLVVQGIWWGTIAFVPHGQGGFGYDPLFIPAGGGGRTAAQWRAEEKACASHRGAALSALVRRLGERQPFPSPQPPSPMT